MHSCHSLKEIADFLKENGWDYDAMQEVILADTMDHVIENMSLIQYKNIMVKSFNIKI